MLQFAAAATSAAAASAAAAADYPARPTPGYLGCRRRPPRELR